MCMTRERGPKEICRGSKNTNMWGRGYMNLSIWPGWKCTLSFHVLWQTVNSYNFTHIIVDFHACPFFGSESIEPPLIAKVEVNLYYLYFKV